MKLADKGKITSEPSHAVRFSENRLADWMEDSLTEGQPAPLPSSATNAPIGSSERLAVYAERARRGEQLHHPDDSLRIHAPGDTDFSDTLDPQARRVTRRLLGRGSKTHVRSL